MLIVKTWVHTSLMLVILLFIHIHKYYNNPYLRSYLIDMLVYNFLFSYYQEASFFSVTHRTWIVVQIRTWAAFPGKVFFANLRYWGSSSQLRTFSIHLPLLVTLYIQAKSCIHCKWSYSLAGMSLICSEFFFGTCSWSFLDSFAIAQ